MLAVQDTLCTPAAPLRDITHSVVTRGLAARKKPRLARATLRDADVHRHLARERYDQALVLLMPRYQNKVFRLCMSMLRHRAAAEDLTQDIFLKVWRALPRYEGQASLSTWIYAIARNACLSELRRRRSHVSLTPDADEGYSAEVASLAAPQIEDSATASVSQVLDQLPERYRRAVTLFYLEDQSYETTARALGLPLGTVKALLHRARKRLIVLTSEATAS